MYPFFVFNLPERTTDEAVRARYLELVARFPPERDRPAFEVVQAAHRQLATQADRVRTRLFYFDRPGQSLLGTDALRVRASVRARISVETLAARLGSGADE